MRRQFDLLALTRHARRLGIEPQRPAFNLGFGMTRRAAHLRADPGQQFFHMERLGQIIVGAGIHAR